MSQALIAYKKQKSKLENLEKIIKPNDCFNEVDTNNDLDEK